jgi:dephospho-CoA kinase
MSSKAPFTDRKGRSRPVPVIGIVGGVASGKSLAAAALAGQGAVMIDADRLAHEELARDEVREALIERFGDGILSAEGAVDRARLGARVFADAEALAFLNRLVHPAVCRRIVERVEEAVTGGAPAVVIDAALLLENEAIAECCTHIMFVDAPAEHRRRRAQAARGWDEAELVRREAAQMPLEAKRRAADAVVANDGESEDLRRRVLEWFEHLTGGRHAEPSGSSLESPN